MNDRVNLIRAWRKQQPEWIPVCTGLLAIDWEEFGYDIKELEYIHKKHPTLFPNFREGQLQEGYKTQMDKHPFLHAYKKYVDDWGCLWETTTNGITGTVTQHPLEDWDALKDFCVPDPDETDGFRTRRQDWEYLESIKDVPREKTGFLRVDLAHGHTFLKAQDIRGYVNFLGDMIEEDERIDQLLDMICDFNLRLIHKFLSFKPDCIGIPEDLGMQNSPMLTPEQFRRYIGPRYRRLTKPIKEAGILIHEHCDGYIMDLLDDIIETGGTILNLQDLVNGIDNIGKYVKGRVSIDLDIDRQNITVNGTPKDIDDHIKECVSKLGSREGGLSLFYQPYPHVSAKNMDAVFTAMEKYCIKDYLFR